MILGARLAKNFPPLFSYPPRLSTSPTSDDSRDKNGVGGWDQCSGSVCGSGSTDAVGSAT